jgi:hypothetical protein
VASDATIEINDAPWRQKIAEYAAHTGKGMREGLEEEWALFLRKVMDFTPPFATKGARSAGRISNSVSDLAIGRKAVAFDIYKTMRPFDPTNIRSNRLKKIVERQDVTAFNAMAARVKSGPMAGAKAVFFDRNIHLRQRNKRGRVTGRDRNVVVLGQGANLLKRYVAEVQGNVGYAKSGWLKALHLVGGKGPNYVEKQGTTGGTVIDGRDDADGPNIEAINRTPWAVRKDEGERISADAKASRINAIIAKIRTKERLARRRARLAA